MKVGRKKQLSAKEFVILLKFEASYFEESWRENQKKNPSTWPESLPEEEWWEQFLLHLRKDPDQ